MVDCYLHLKETGTTYNDIPANYPAKSKRTSHVSELVTEQDEPTNLCVIGYLANSANSGIETIEDEPGEDEPGEEEGPNHLKRSTDRDIQRNQYSMLGDDELLILHLLVLGAYFFKGGGWGTIYCCISV